MPYVRKNKRSTNKRPRKPASTGKPKSNRITGYKPRYNRGPFSTFSRADPFKPYYRARMHFTGTVTLGTNASTIEFGPEEIYRLNSCFDPDYSGLVSSQPYGFSTMADLYNKYKVSGVLINLVFTDPSADGLTVAATVQPPGNLATLQGANPDAVREQPMSITRSVNNSGKQVITIKQYMPMHTLLGVTKSQFHNELDLYAGFTNGNPSQTPLLRVAVANLRGGSTQSILCRTSLTFYTQFYNRKEIP